MFVLNDRVHTGIYTYVHALSLHDALPIWPATMRPHPRRSSGKKACWTSLLFGARSLRFQGQADRAQLALALRLQRLGGFGRPLERNAQQFASADLAGRLDDQLIAACRKLSERRLAFGKAQDMLAGRAGRAADSVHRHVQRPPGLAPPLEIGRAYV